MYVLSDVIAHYFWRNIVNGAIMNIKDYRFSSRFGGINVITGHCSIFYKMKVRFPTTTTKTNANQFLRKMLL